MIPSWPFWGGNHFPGTNMHELDLNWIIKSISDFINQYEQIQKLINDTTNEDLAKLDAKYNNVIQLLNLWYTEHSADLTDELTQAVADLNEQAAITLESIPADYSTVAYRSQDTINSAYFDLIVTESGTFNDSDGVTKTSNNARKRNRTPIPIAEVAYIDIPSGYEVYTYCLDGNYTKFDVVSWTNTALNTKNLPANTKYINVAVRKIANPSDDISAINIPLNIIKKNRKAVPRWNIEEGGISIDGNTIIVNENGFTLIYYNNVYHIAPLDLTTITRFPVNAGDVKTLVIDTSLLSPNVRNEPSTVMTIMDDIPYSLANNKYIPVAYYYKTYWEFSSEFSNLYNITKLTKEPDYVTWNNTAGGLRFEGYNAIVNENGFCFTFNGHSYYIAPTDNSTITTFTPEDINSTYVLVIDPLLINPGVRTNPSDCMSIQSFRGTTYSKQYISVALFYKGTWEFNGKFRNLNFVKPCAVNDIFNQQHIIAHKGGNTQTENTIDNFEDAISNGYKIVEADVHVTSDNVPVLHHDATFVVNNVTYTIAEMTYAQIIAVYPDMATLEQLLILCKRNNICIDLDCSHAYTTAKINTIYNTVKKYGCMSRVMFTCFVATAKQILNNGQAIICLSQIDTEAELKTVYDIINKSALCICSVQNDNFSYSVCDLIHEYGALVKLWTVNTASAINDAFDLTVDMVISDSVKESDL